MWPGESTSSAGKNMRIVIASSYEPFRRGSERTAVDHLAGALRERDYQVDTVVLPFTRTAAEEMLAIRSLDLTEASGNKIDLLITMRAPAHALPHPNKVAWLAGERQEVRYLSASRRVCARSKTAAQRVKE